MRIASDGTPRAAVNWTDSSRPSPFSPKQGCRRVWLNGSFVTAKDEPGDFDAVWDPDEVDTDQLDPIFFDLTAGREEQKSRFYGELFPDWTESGSGLRFAEFFQRDRVHGFKGIVVIDPRSIHS